MCGLSSPRMRGGQGGEEVVLGVQKLAEGSEEIKERHPCTSLHILQGDMGVHGHGGWQKDRCPLNWDSRQVSALSLPCFLQLQAGIVLPAGI